MADSMIERVARALCDSQETTDLNWDSWVHAVKVVLREMREPTEAMKLAGVRAMGGDGSVLDGYEAMIDAALEEGR